MCKHCERCGYGPFNKTQPIPVIDGIDEGYMRVTPERGTLVAAHPEAEKDVYGIFINFCPICGRDLKEAQ